MNYTRKIIYVISINIFVVSTIQRIVNGYKTPTSTGCPTILNFFKITNRCVYIHVALNYLYVTYRGLQNKRKGIYIQSYKLSR